MSKQNHSRALAARLFAAGTLLASAGNALADVRYVDLNSTSPTTPYTSWVTAATNIQDAVDAAVAGDEIVVTNGIYANGERATVDVTTPSRVAVDKPLSLRSANGPQFTSIDGGGAVRCVYLISGANLSGFTLTNGFADQGGGLRCESPSAVVSNCVVSSNSAPLGGGGALGGTLNNCTLKGNTAVYGGGAFLCTLNNCAVTDNSASGSSGGGGVGGCILNNCTVTGNSALGLGPFSVGGGAHDSVLNNCIVYFNTAPQDANYSSSTMNYSCTTPQPTNGFGNLSLDPQLASSSHLSANSPCRGAGNSTYASGTDIDGESWASPPSIGCDEYHVGTVNGSLNVAIAASLKNVLTGYTVELAAFVEGRATASVWDYGDGIRATNQPYSSHAWTALGDYAVVLRAFNESYPDGVSATVAVHVVTQPVHYVVAANGNPAAPYTSWATAATNIQDAVDAATVPGALVLVTNGIYAPIRVGADKLLTVLSVSGPHFTFIDGGQAVRCVYLTSGASLSGFTLTNGFICDGKGAGVACESQTAVVSNSVIAGNVAANCDLGGANGGGAYGGTLDNCTLRGNRAVYGGGAYLCILNNCTLTGNDGGGAYGGGAFHCTLNNCTLTGNSAASGGGASYCALNNCLVYFNTSTNAANYDSSSTLNYSCTTPLPTNGVSNITNAPLFVDQASGNLRLQSSSPCINAGLNALVPAGADLDGNPRIAGGTVDIGAYEFQSPTSIISYAWRQQFGLPTDGSADTADPDGDGLNNWQEWRCGTDPTNALSALRLLTPAPGGSGLVVKWESVADRTYFLERSTIASSRFTPLAVGIPGQPGTTTYTDTNAIGAGPWFYRVGAITP